MAKQPPKSTKQGLSARGKRKLTSAAEQLSGSDDYLKGSIGGITYRQAVRRKLSDDENERLTDEELDRILAAIGMEDIDKRDHIDAALWRIKEHLSAHQYRMARWNGFIEFYEGQPPVAAAKESINNAQDYPWYDNYNPVIIRDKTGPGTRQWAQKGIAPKKPVSFKTNKNRSVLVIETPYGFGLDQRRLVEASIESFLKAGAVCALAPTTDQVAAFLSAAAKEKGFTTLPSVRRQSEQEIDAIPQTGLARLIRKGLTQDENRHLSDFDIEKIIDKIGISGPIDISRFHNAARELAWQRQGPGNRVVSQEEIGDLLSGLDEQILAERDSSDVYNQPTEGRQSGNRPRPVIPGWLKQRIDELEEVFAEASKQDVDELEELLAKLKRLQETVPNQGNRRSIEEKEEYIASFDTPPNEIPKTRMVPVGWSVEPELREALGDIARWFGSNQKSKLLREMVLPHLIYLVETALELAKQNITERPHKKAKRTAAPKASKQ